jgi:molybdenum cofactor synthesis domain-containing protein
MVSAAVLTVSDTASVNNLLDKSGPAAADFLKARGYRLLHTEIISDDAQLIRRSIAAWVNDRSHPVDLIVTTGGTGLGARDVTPEVLNSPLSVLGVHLSRPFVGRVISDRAPRPWIGPPDPLLIFEAHSICIAFPSSSWNHRKYPGSHPPGKCQGSERKS